MEFSVRHSLPGRLRLHVPLLQHPSLLAEALLFYAARADHLERLIRPALAQGRWVICDRFADSSRVYQGVAGGLPPHVFDRLDELVVRPTLPDLTFVLDLAAEVGLERALQRRRAHAEADAFEKRDLSYHQRLREGFAAIASLNPGRCLLIDARHGIKELDRPVMHVLDDSGVSFQVVLTKTDKLGADELANIAERVVGDLAPHAAAYPEIHLTSALKRQGIAALRATLGSLALSGSTPAICLPSLFAVTTVVRRAEMSSPNSFGVWLRANTSAGGLS